MELALSTPYMQAKIVDGVGWMMFNNPDRRNAMKLEMNRAVVEILDAFAASDDVRVAVMYGSGDKAFVSGADISEFNQYRSTPEGRAHFDAVSAGAAQAFAGFPKPLIAMIRGFCMGGGLATALQADIRITADDGQFGIPAARLGLGYAFGGVHKLTHIVGPTKAAEILLTARRFSADEAEAMGLVNQVVAGADLESVVGELAATIAANAPLTVRAAKASVRAAVLDPGQRDIDHVNQLVETCFLSEDYVEGRTAFMEKRPPVFRGR